MCSSDLTDAKGAQDHAQQEARHADPCRVKGQRTDQRHEQIQKQAVNQRRHKGEQEAQPESPQKDKQGNQHTTVITVTTKDGGHTATCVLTVIAKEEDEESYKPDETDTSIYFITAKTLSNGTYDSSADEYTFSINQNYKQIYVNAPDKTIVVELNGVTIENGTNAPIYVEDCEGIEISAKKNTVNHVKDKRTSLVGESYKGAIYVANGDLKLKGTGTLNIESTYYNGVHCKDDVKVQKQTLNITAPGHGIKGNDSVTITSGTIPTTWDLQKK